MRDNVCRRGYRHCLGVKKPGLQACEYCLSVQARLARESRSLRKKLKICTVSGCKKRVKVKGKARCDGCAAKYSALKKAWLSRQAPDHEARRYRAARDSMTARGLCVVVSCGRDAVVDETGKVERFCPRHSRANKKRCRERHARKSTEARLALVDEEMREVRQSIATSRPGSFVLPGGGL